MLYVNRIVSICSEIFWFTAISQKQIFRHGDRNPIEPYPNDPYKNGSYWPEGFGQLTNVSLFREIDIFRAERDKFMYFLD